MLVVVALRNQRMQVPVLVAVAVVAAAVVVVAAAAAVVVAAAPTLAAGGPKLAEDQNCHEQGPLSYIQYK
jgi:hypothetical protein